jgi:hypothetical protein
MKTLLTILKTAVYIGIWVSLFLLGRCALQTIRDNGWHEECGKSQTSSIYSLHTQTNVSGSFVLGVGSVSGQDCYVFYKRTKSGGFIRESIPTEWCVLYEGNYVPKIVEYGCLFRYLVNGIVTKTTFNRTYHEHYQQIYIPLGTITERITDLK